MENPTANAKDELIKLLEGRYARKKSALYEWFKICGVNSIKRDGLHCFEEEDLAKLDRLNEWVNNGNKPIDFPERVEISAITTVEESRIEEHSMPIQSESIPDDFTQLIRVSQEKGAGLLIAQNLLAKQFADNPNLLPPDLLKQVKETEQAIAPKSQSPKDYANRFMQLTSMSAA
jgi:hypothetical protein